jgi:ADP-dependent NAD(P)H-hydrate dehydratase / NAD(P)H-hydrate epimerase
MGTASPHSYILKDILPSWLPKRPKNSHKGNNGHVLIVGGDYGFAGATLIAAHGALRSGAGLVTIATRPEHAHTLFTACPEIMTVAISGDQDLKKALQQANTVVLGPGLGQSAWSQDLFHACIPCALPTLMDADALTFLSKNPHHCDHRILTPHPGEAATLLGTTSAMIQTDRAAAIKSLHKKYGGCIVLKGAGSLITKGTALIRCEQGNPGMGSGGMGDLLSGIIAALCAQGLEQQKAAILGVLIHATAADEAAIPYRERGLIASDLLPFIHRLVNHSS